MDYTVTIDSFEGPLDLLLHLIKKEDIKIEDISIERITEQYLNYIKKMEELDLNIASEYLVIAAELIEIKSYLLVPKIETEEVEEDPRERLIERLLEYKAYKEVTGEFKDLESERKTIFTKSPSDLNAFKSEEEVLLFDQVSIDVLIEAFKNLMARKELEKPLDTKITTKEYSIQVRNSEIKTILKNKKKVEFTELFDHYTKEYFVITFLSILDLSKKQELEIVQDNNFSKIYLLDKGD